MRYNIVYSLTASLLTATAIPLGIPLGNGRFAYPDKSSLTGRRVISEGPYYGKFPDLKGEFDDLPIANKEKREAVYVGEFDDPRKQGRKFWPWINTGADSHFGLGIGPEVSSTIGKRATAGEFKRAAEPFMITPEQAKDWVVPEGCKGEGFFCLKEKREAEAEAEPIVLLPGDEPINPEGCDDPLICASLKEKREAEAKPIVLLPGEEPINPEGCDDPLICASLKEKREAEAEAEPIVLLPGEEPINPEGCDDPWCASLKEKRDAEAIVKLPGVDFVNPEGCDDPLICASLKEKREAEPEPIMLLPGMEPVNPEGCDEPWCASLK